MKAKHPGTKGNGTGIIPAIILISAGALLAAGCSNPSDGSSGGSGTAGAVTYSANGADGGDVPVDPGTYEDGDVAVVLGNTGNLTRSGYSFAGWNTGSGGDGMGYLEGSDCAVGSGGGTLYALWSRNVHTLTFDANDGSGGTGSAVVAEGATVKLPNDAFAREDCAFDGWNSLAAGDGESYDALSDFTMGAADATVYAQWNEGFSCGTSNGGVTVTDYAGGERNLTIPSAFNGYPVTGIGRYAFGNRSDLDSVVLPDSVETLCEYAFSNCDGLTTIAVPASVESIGEEAFRSCDRLTSITAAEGNPAYRSRDGVLFTRDGTFLHSYPAGNARTSYSVPSSVVEIGGCAFYECTELETLILPDSVETIGDSAFAWCYGLTSASLGSSVAVIDDDAFSYCYGLPSIAIPASITEIGDSAFMYCDLLATVTVNALQPPALAGNAFERNAPGRKFLVPAGSVNGYKEAAGPASGWRLYQSDIEAQEE